MDIKVIYVHRDDDLASVVEKVLLAKAKNVVLVIFKESEIAKHRINFQILKRESEYAGKEIFVETNSDFIKTLCQEEGIKLAQDYQGLLESGRMTAGKTQIADIVVPKEEEPEQEAFQEPEPALEPEPEEPEPETIKPLGDFSKKFEIKDEEEVENIPIHNQKEIKKVSDFSEKSEKSSLEKKIEEADDFWEMLEKKHLEKKSQITLSSGKKGQEKKKITYEETSDFSDEITKQKKAKKWHYLIWSGIVASLAIGFYFAFFVLPRAEVTVNLKKAKKEVELSLTVSKDAQTVDAKNYIIPGKALTFERVASKTFPATDYKNVESKASGIIRIYNAYSSAPQVLIATTRFKANKSGKIFRIPKRVVIPGAKIKSGKIEPSYVEVRVYADKPGEEYNIGPDKFSIPGFKGTDKYYGFYAQSFKPMTGGKVGKAKVVSAADIKKAKQTIASELTLLLKKEFEEKIPPEYKKISNNFVLEKKILEADVQENAIRDSFTVKADFILKGIVFKNKDLEALAQKIFADLEEAQDWDIKTIDYEFSDQGVDSLKNKLTANLKIKYNLVRKIDKEELKNEILGQDSDDVKKILLLKKEVNSAKVVFWPFWVSRIPDDPQKLDLRFE